MFAGVQTKQMHLSLGDLTHQIPADMWEPSSVRQDEGAEQTTWLPVLDLGKSGHRVGFDASGVWLVETSRGRALNAARANYIPLLPVLELDPLEVEKSMTRTGVRIGIPRLMDYFPINEILLTAARGTSSYWVARALNWAETHRMSDAVRDRLARVAHAPWASQDVRHRARRLLRASSRSVEP
jgi:hypothetical protein